MVVSPNRARTDMRKRRREGTAAGRQALVAALLATPPALLQPLHHPRCPLVASRPAFGGAWFLARGPVLGRDAAGGDAGHALVAGRRPQAAGEHGRKARHCDRDDIDHDPGEQQPGTGQEPQRRHDDPALVVHPRVGRLHGVSKPRVTGAERLLDLLELALLVFRERHGTLRCNPSGDALARIRLTAGLMPTVRECTGGTAHPSCAPEPHPARLVASLWLPPHPINSRAHRWRACPPGYRLDSPLAAGRPSPAGCGYRPSQGTRQASRAGAAGRGDGAWSV